MLLTKTLYVPVKNKTITKTTITNFVKYDHRIKMQ